MSAAAQRAFPIPRAHATFRSTPVWLGFNGLGVVFMSVLLIPPAAHALRVRAPYGIVATLVLLAAVNAATIVYRRHGLSLLYRVLDTVEGVITELFHGFLVFASGSAMSFLWLFYLAHTVMAASVGTTVPNLAVIAGGPAAMALAFACNHDVASAMLSLLAGGLGVSLYVVVARTHDDLERSRRREASLETKLAQVRVSEERTRISRDLHDGVAAELTGLIWRIRRLEDDAALVTRHELVALEGRIAKAIADLRGVVLDLRTEPGRWGEAIDFLGEQCLELCQGLPLEVEVDGRPSGERALFLWPEIQRIVLELVRNAVRHAGASRITVQIAVTGTHGPELRLGVSDDGRGLPPEHWRKSRGGLRNVQRRAAELLGWAELLPAQPGTRVCVTLPLCEPATGGGPSAPTQGLPSATRV